MTQNTNKISVLGVLPSGEDICAQTTQPLSGPPLQFAEHMGHLTQPLQEFFQVQKTLPPGWQFPSIQISQKTLLFRDSAMNNCLRKPLSLTPYFLYFTRWATVGLTYCLFLYNHYLSAMNCHLRAFSLPSDLQKSR